MQSCMDVNKTVQVYLCILLLSVGLVAIETFLETTVYVRLIRREEADWRQDMQTCWCPCACMCVQAHTCARVD